MSASSAFAAIGLPWTNSSDLILLVENTTTTASYALDTGISLNSILPQSSLIGGANLVQTLAGINASIAESSALQTFLSSNPVAGDGWTLIGGQYAGGGANTAGNLNNTRPAGAGIVAYSSTINANQGGHIVSNLNSILNGLQTDLTTGGTMNGLTTATEATGTGFAPGAITKYGVVAADSLGALGTAQTFYAFTGNNGSGTLQSYIMGSATLGTNGMLSITGNTAAAPLPAAAWLFGSGIMGLVGVSRRRKTAV
jgi:hypothetical protein